MPSLTREMFTLVKENPKLLGYVTNLSLQSYKLTSPDPGTCGMLSGIFTFTRIQTFPSKPFVTFMMTCDRLKIVLGRNKRDECQKYTSTVELSLGNSPKK